MARDIRLLAQEVPLEHSDEWFAVRASAATSSRFATMDNKWGNRNRELRRRNIRSAPTFPMRWGTMLEDCSGFLFTHITGMPFEDLGSVEHRVHKRIRGTVDGWGIGTDSASTERWVLETKSPCTRDVSPSLSNRYYYFQIIQNIEVLEADVGFFNTVRMLPATTADLATVEDCREPINGVNKSARFSHYGLADACDKRCNMIAANVYNVPSRTKPQLSYTDIAEYDLENVTLENIEAIHKLSSPTFNFGDLYNINNDGKVCQTAHLHRRTSLFNVFMMSERFRVVPFAACESTDFTEWVDALPVDDESIGRLYLKIDSASIERIERQQSFWEQYLLPIANQWVQDLDRAKRGEPLSEYHGDLSFIELPLNVPPGLR